MDLKLDPESLRVIVSEAILAKLSDEQKGTLITSAIASLMEPKDNNSRGYGCRTRLEDAFVDGVTNMARKLATEMLTENEEVKTKLRDLLTEAMERVLVTKREATITQIAAAITKGLEGTTRDY